MACKVRHVRATPHLSIEPKKPEVIEEMLSTLLANTDANQKYYTQ